MQRISTQAAANCNLFDTLPIGAAFATHVVSRTKRGAIRAVYVRQRYIKVDAEHVQTADGRVVHLGATEAGGASVVLVPDGARSVEPYISAPIWSQTE